ncbi:MAG TPA: RES family NAD+ phosphorylase [Syntrophorhabdaceae bacterium]|nr:RES family NAD+ phosphorylase [Syntrophorhabdaceae bacterium]
MRRAWRIVRKKRLADAFTGEGARLGGGRWNHVGTPVVYVRETLSLAALELFVHFTRKDIKLTKSLLAIPVEIPSHLKIIEISIKDLNFDWRISPPSNSTKDIGTEWVQKGSSAVLRVPSAIVQEEYNLLLNPNHGDFKRMRIGKPQPFTLDERMWK